ncbi:transposase [Streptosporangium sp. NPDC000095]|uniref:transposase n=1 Tax=Streptosporangium sp. NPDC000095 TaxID=3366184 RepID=UPI0036C9AD35
MPDCERNRSWLTKIKHRLAWAGYPTVMLMTLVETGTRGLLGAVFGSITTGETRYARRLCGLLGPDMLVLADRAFDGNQVLGAVGGSGAQFLVRLKSTRRPPMAARLCDGSFLSRIGEMVVRIIDADITVICADGTKVAGRYRLATTLLDPRRDSAAALIRLYHERWEIESAYLALRHTLLGGRVLRSGDPIGLEQELWALLTVYQALRMAMVAAAESVPGTDPDRACFKTAAQAARDQVIIASGVLPADPAAPLDLVGVIGRAVLDGLLPPRRPRISVRKVKSPISRYHARPHSDERPLTSQNVTDVLVVVHEGQTVPPPPPPSEQEQEQEQEQPEDMQPASPSSATSAR